MAESAIAISFLRSNRSARTPPKGDTKNWGRMPQTIETVIIVPDWVVIVMCQMIAYCTNMEPNSDRVWLPMNTATSLSSCVP